MPIPSQDLTLLRKAATQVSVPVYNYWPKQVVASGLITATPTLYPIGQVSVAWTGGMYANIQVGQLWVIRANDAIVSYGVVSKPSTASILYIDGKSRGDSGIAVSQAFGITANQTITVYTIKPIWSLLSRIVDGKFYKKFDVPYDGSGGNPSPVVNIGKWRQAYANIYGYADLSFSSANSFTWLGKSVASILWTLPAGVTLLSGSLTSTSFTARFPQGFHLVTCRYIDSGGAQQTATRPVWINGPDYPAMSDLYAYEITSDQQTRQGRNQDVTMYGQFDHSDFLPGFPMHYKKYTTYDGLKLSDNILVDTFVGYTSDRNLNHDLYNGEQGIEFKLAGPWAMFEQIPMVSQAIVEVASPAAWTDIATGLGYPDFIAYYILKHHTTYLDLFDYMPLHETRPTRRLNWGLNGDTVSAYLSQVSGAIGGNIGAVSDGSLYLRRDPNLEESNYRSNVDTRMTITMNEDDEVYDLTAPIVIPRKMLPNTGQVRIFTLCYSGTTTTAFGSIAPGFTQLQAPGSQDEDSLVVKPEMTNVSSSDPSWEPGGQDKTNRLSGHLLARANNPTPEISLALRGDMDVFEPARMLWAGLDVLAKWSPTKQGLDTRTLPISIDRTWEEGDKGFHQVITMVVAPETYGQPGETFVIDKGGATNYPPVVPPSGNNDNNDEEGLDDVSPFMIAVNEYGRIGRTKNGLQWVDIQGNMKGRVQGFDFDYFSPYPQSGWSEGNLGAWAITAVHHPDDAADIYAQAEIWYTPNILATKPTWSVQYQVHKAVDLQNALRIMSNAELEGYVAATVSDEKRVQVVRTLNGTTWSAVNAGETYGFSFTYSRNHPADLTFDGQQLITSGWHNTDGGYRLVRFSTPTASTAFVSSSPISSIPWPMIKSDPDNGYVFATRVLKATETSTGSASVFVNSSAQAVAGFSGILNSGRVKIYQDASLPNSTIAFMEQGSVSTGTPSTCAQAPEPLHLESGFVAHTSADTPYAEVPAKVFPSDYYHGWVGAVSNFGWAQAEFHFNGTATVEIVAQSVEWLVLYSDEFGICGAVIVTAPQHRVDMYNSFGLKVYSNTDTTGNNDPDGTSYTHSSTHTDIATVVLTFATAGYPPFVYPTFMYEGASVVVSKIDTDTPETYRIANIHTVGPNFHEMDMPDEKFPMNPFSLHPNTPNEEIVAAIRYGNGIISSRIATATFDGQDWEAMDDEVQLYGIIQNGDYGIAWGREKILVTKTSWETANNIVGDWSTAIGPMGVFRYVKGILS